VQLLQVDRGVAGDVGSRAAAAVRDDPAALAPLFDRLPGGAALGTGLGAAPGAVDRGYHLIADNRITLSRLVPGAFKRWAGDALERREA